VVDQLVGQLYLVRVRGQYKGDDGIIEKMSLIMQARNEGEISTKISYMLDISKYCSFSITRIEKIRPRFHILSTNKYAVSDIKMVQRLRIEGSKLSADKQRTNGTSANQPRWAFGLIGGLNADNEQSAFRRIGRWLLSLGLDGEVSSPMFETFKLILEEEGEIDSTVTSATVLAGMDGTHFTDQKPFQGGAPSLGRR
jgi:hypothetical protein